MKIRTMINYIPLNVTIFIFVFCLLFFSFPQWDSTHQAYGLYFGNNFVIDSANVSSSSVEGQITSIEKGGVYVVWVDKNNIYFCSSQENGTKFSTPILLSDNNTQSSSPQIAATEKGSVYVVWVDKNNVTGDSNVIFRSSNDNGKDFNHSVYLSRNPNQTSTSSSPQIAATENGSVYVVWVDKNNATGDSNVIFRSSNDNGKDFNHSVYLSRNPNQTSITSSPQIAATEKGSVYVVWVDEKKTTGDSNIELIRSNDTGKGFSNRITLRAGDHLSYSPQITATEKGDVYVVWVDKNEKTGDSDITFRSSNDSGRNFDDRKNLRSSNTLLSSSPQMTATEKGDVYVVWVDKNSTIGDSDITFRSSNDRGRDFERAINLNKGEKKLYNDSSPQIVTTAKDRVNVVWVNNHVEFKEILVQDALVGKTILLSNITAWSSFPQLTATEKGDVYVVWVDKNSTTNASLQIKRISEYFFDRNS
jgi:hypothetical protein